MTEHDEPSPTFDREPKQFNNFQSYELTPEELLYRVEAIMTGGRVSESGDGLQALSDFGDRTMPGIRSSETNIEVAVDTDENRIAISKDLMWASEDNHNIDGRATTEVNQLVEELSTAGRDASARWQGDFYVLEIEPFEFDAEHDLGRLVQSVLYQVLLIERMEGFLPDV